MKKIYVGLIIICVFGCDKENSVSPDQIISCSEFSEALIAKDSKTAEPQITKFFNSLNQTSGIANVNQQKEDLNKFVSQINKCATLKVIDTCLQCVYTIPPIFELRISISANVQHINQ